MSLQKAAFRSFRFICILGLFLILPLPSFAADLSVGASTWYAHWTMKQKNNGKTDKTNMKSELLFGPAASLKLSADWSLSSVFLYSSAYKMKNDNGSNGEQSTDKITRMDSDTLANYSINRYFKVFSGVKFMRFSFKNGYHQSAGPGAGTGVMLPLPLLDNLFFISNVSGSYLWGKHKDPDSKTGMVEYGVNATANIAYYIEKLTTSINAGYRFQMFRSEYKKTGNDNTHLFRGFTASIVYSF